MDRHRLGSARRRTRLGAQLRLGPGELRGPVLWQPVVPSSFQGKCFLAKDFAHAAPLGELSLFK